MARSNMGFIRRVDRVPLQRQKIARELFTPRRIRAQQGSATAKAMGAVAVAAVGAGIGEYLFAYREVNGATQLERAGSHISSLDRVVPAAMGFVALEVPFLIALGIARLARGGRKTAQQVQRVTGVDILGESSLAAPQPPARPSGALPAIIKRSDPKMAAVSLSPGVSLPASASIPIPIDVTGGAPANGFKIGQILSFGADRYEILGQLGAGGMGKVYKVRYLNNGEIQALKVLLFDKPNARSRFVKEAIAIRELTQRSRKGSGEWEPLDGVVGYKGFSETAGACYLFMEFLDGLPLYDFVNNLDKAYAEDTGVPTEQRIRDLQLIKLGLFQGQFQTLGAVYAAKQIIHRDLKGENVFVVRDAQGQPHIKIFDWGLAKEINKIPGTQPESTIDGESFGIKGTPSHMPPEMVWAGMTDPNGNEFDPNNIGIQADMYSSGVMVYTSLVGRLPFDVKLCNLIPMHHSPQAPQLVIPDFIRPRTAEVLRRLLARYPNDRPRDYAEVNGLMKAAITEISG